MRKRVACLIAILTLAMASTAGVSAEDAVQEKAEATGGTDYDVPERPELHDRRFTIRNWASNGLSVPEWLCQASGLLRCPSRDRLGLRLLLPTHSPQSGHRNSHARSVNLEARRSHH